MDRASGWDDGGGGGKGLPGGEGGDGEDVPGGGGGGGSVPGHWPDHQLGPGYTGLQFCLR